MSVQETLPRPQSPLHFKPEPKPRPEIPPKPSTQATSPPPGERGSGKVKRIVSKFSNQGSVSKRPEARRTNGTAGHKSHSQFKRAPTVKPKPGRSSLQLQIGTEQAPPLPMKRSRLLHKQKEITAGDDRDGVGVEGGRSGTVGQTDV